MSESKKQIQNLFWVIAGIAACGGIFTTYLLISRYIPSVYIFCDVSPQEKCLNVYKLFTGGLPVEFFGVFIYLAMAVCAGLLAHGFTFQKISRFIGAKKIIFFLHFLMAASLGTAAYILFFLFGKSHIFSWPPLIHTFLIIIIWTILIYASLRIKKAEQETKTCDFC